MQISIRFETWFPFVLLGLILIYYGSMAYAATWEFTPSVLGAGTYSDNIGLDPDGEEADDFVFQLNRALEISGEGRRLTGDFSYLMQNLLFVKESDANETFHQLSGNAVGEIIRETFFIDGITTFSQQVIDPEGRVSRNNINLTGNQSDTFTASVGPRWEQRLGDITQASLSYSYRIVDFLDKEDPNNRGGNIQDSREHWVLINLENPVDQRLAWDLGYEWNQITFEDDRIDKFQKIGLELDYQLTRIVGLIALGGYEKNDFQRNVSDGKTDGEVWEVGVRLEPTPRDELEARFGERFFGDIKSFEWTHTARRITTEFIYFEDITTGNQVLVGTDFSPGQGINPDVARRRGEIFVRKRFDATITVDLPKSTLRLNGFYVRRKFQTSGENDQNSGGELDWEWQFRPRSLFTVNLYYARNKFGSGNNRNNNDGWVELELKQEFGPKTEGFIQLTHRRRDADTAEDEYRENTASIGIIRTF